MKLATATLLAFIAASGAISDVKGPNGKVIDCYCTDSGGSRVELGETICLFVDGRAFMAQCDMSLNVPIWRDTGDDCLSSHLYQSLPENMPQPLQPTLYTRFVLAAAKT